MKLAGPAANGLFLSSNFVPTNPDPKVQKFVGEYKAKFGVVPNQFAAQAYDAMGIMLAALMKVGPNVTRDSLRDALAATKDYPGVTGVTTFDPVTREPQKTVVRMTIANGESSWWSEVSAHQPRPALRLVRGGGLADRGCRGRSG